jgi:hypothetical protein
MVIHTSNVHSWFSKEKAVLFPIVVQTNHRAVFEKRTVKSRIQIVLAVRYERAASTTASYSTVPVLQNNRMKKDEDDDDDTVHTSCSIDTVPYDLAILHKSTVLLNGIGMRSIRVFLFLQLILAISAAASTRPWWKRFQRPHKKKEEMGQAVRLMRYDRAGNEAAALPALELLGQGLKWFRLDDGVMGGQSETAHSSEKDGLHFSGNINTDGGGFCSIRAKMEQGFDKAVTGIKLKMTGDGKTYKFTLSDRNSSTGGPFGRSPNWQVDLPTSGKEQDVIVPFSSLKPAFGGRQSSKPSAEEIAKYTFDPSSMREIGLMLSLRLSDGSPNPKETFGEGLFPFSLKIKSIEPVGNEASK